MGFRGVLIKQHIGENARKLVKTGLKNGSDFFTHAHIRQISFLNWRSSEFCKDTPRDTLRNTLKGCDSEKKLCIAFDTKRN